MPWELRIHHLDIGSAGDATVIVARFLPGGPGPAITRSVLIDGGKVGSADMVHDYLENVLGLPQIDVIVVTHFDEDHFYGISRMLQMHTNGYDDTAYVIAAAMGAVAQGATAAQAAAVAAVIGATLTVADARNTAHMTVDAATHADLAAPLPATHADLAAPLPATQAAVVGAVAAAAYYLGVPAEVRFGTEAALARAGVATAGAAAAQGTGAATTAQLNPDNILFKVKYTSVHGPQIVNHGE